MADAILMSGGVGGVTSDDVTATKAHVLAGHKTVTFDSNDEIAEGTMRNCGYHGPDSSEMWYYAAEGGYVVRLEAGYYHPDDNSGLKPYIIAPTNLVKEAVGYNPDKTLNDITTCGIRGNIPIREHAVDTVEFFDAHWESKYYARMEQGYYPQNGQYKPAVGIPYAVMANIIGLNPSKMLKSLSIAGKQGQIEERGSYVNAEGVWYYNDGNYLVGQIPPGYYGGDNGNGKTNVNISKQDLINNLGLNPDLWLDSFQTMGIRGKIQRWICNTTDILETTQGFAYNDAANGRGQGIVMAIKNGHKIENANWIFLRMPDLLSHNIRQGVNLGGVIGTMPDYSTGRTVFNGATFDGVLVSGVAAKGFYYNDTYFAYFIQNGFGYGGIYNGGINLQMSTDTPSLRSRRIGCVLSQSINVTPFSRIVVYYRTVANIQGLPYATLEAHISHASVRGQVQTGGILVDTIDVIRRGYANPISDREGQIVLNVSDINEFIFLSFGAYCNVDRNNDIFAGSVQITRIDFAN